MNWTIGVSGTHDNTVAFSRNEREPYGLKGLPNDLPSHIFTTTVKTRFRKTGDTQPVEYPQGLASPAANPVPEGEDCLRIERAS